jgi:two-component system chemotaxis response regulator CheB
MPDGDIIVIGASAGGVEALEVLVRGLPPDLPAALFVVLHIPADAPSVLPAILSRRGRLPATHPADGEEIKNGHIYVAPPDHHLVVERDKVRVVKGPRENRHRPSVDVLFRSAAVAYGPSVIGVILSGTMDDGVVGLQSVKACGGVAVVQDPEDALYSSMPENALEKVSVDFKVPAIRMGRLLGRLISQAAPEGEYKVPHRMKIEDDLAKNKVAAADVVPQLGEPSAFTCPECHGTLFELDNGEILRFRCRVGHAYTADSLVADHAESLESALWVALRTLEESVALSRRMAERAREDGHDLVAANFEERAAERDEQADVIRKVLFADKQPSGNEVDSEAS